MNPVLIVVTGFAYSLAACAGLLDAQQVTGPSPQSSIIAPPQYALPIDKVKDINKQLMDVCAKLRRQPTDAVARATHTNALNAQLSALVRFDKDVRDLGTAAGEEGLEGTRAQCLHRRAAAWLNGWWACGVLIESASLSADETQRLRLIGDDSTSALSMLLTIYSQMRAGEEDQVSRLRNLMNKETYLGLSPAEWKEKKEQIAKWLNSGKAEEPLRLVLATNTQLNDTLGSPDDFRTKASGHSPSVYVIPGASDLVGLPYDVPRRTDPAKARHLMSLWSLVNLQLDTWNNWAPEHQSAPPLSPGLNRLALWLEALESNRDILSFDGKEPFGAAIKVRIGKLHRFLTFRDQVANEATLRNILKSIAVDRSRQLEQQAGPRGVVPDLVDAADSADKEYLADAAIWLRYVVLLSYQGEGWIELGRGGANDLEPYWTRHKLPQVHFDLPATPSRGVAVLRWNAWPAPGHSAHVLADLVAAATSYLRMQTDTVRAEQMRYVVGFPAYHRLRQKVVLNFENSAKQHVRVDDKGARNAPNLIANFRALQNRSWNRSLTQVEETRLAGDYADLQGRLRTACLQQTLLLKITERQKGEQEFGALTALSAFPELNDCNLGAGASGTFEEHARRVRELYADIQQQVQEGTGEKRLLRAYELRQYQAGTAELDSEAAVFALKAAQQSLEMARLYEQIAKLDTQIRDLYKQAAELKFQEYKSVEKAAGIRFTLATRARDLAAAQLGALKAALDQAQELIKSTEEGLLRTQGDLLRRATEIEKEKQRAFIVGLIKSAIRIVGAVLAPFTGGASLAIAQAATMAVDLAANADQMDWSNVGAIVQNAGTIAQSGAQITTKIISVSGDDKLKQGWTDLQTQFATVQQHITDVSKDTKRLIDGIANTGTFQPVVAAVSAAAAGWPIEYKNNALTFDVTDLVKIDITDSALSKALDAVMKSGGIFVNNATERVRRLSQLPVLQGDQLRTELAKAVDELVKVAPAQVLAKYKQAGVHITNAVQEVEDATNRLKSVLNDSTSDGRNQVLARLLASGMIFVTDGDGKVTAIARPVKQELDNMKKRAKAVQHQILDGAIGTVVRAIQDRTKELTAQIDAAEKAQDQDQLRAIANVTVPNIIDQLKGNQAKSIPGELDKLQDAITVAQGDLEDKQLAMDVASFEKAAAQFAEDAAKLRLQGEALALQNALNYERVADVRRQRDTLLVEEKQRLVEVKQQNSQLAIIALQFAKQECVDDGIDPDTGNASAYRAGPFAGGGTRLAGALFRGRDTDISARLLLRDLTAEFVGMLRWVNLLRLRIPSESSEKLDAVGWYGRLIQELATNASAAQHAKVIASYASNVASEFGKQAPSSANMTAVMAQHSRIRIRYFGSLDDVNTDPWLSLQDEELRKQTIARLDCWITNQHTNLDAVNPQTAADNLYALTSAMELVVNSHGEVSSLRFSVVPPDDAVPYPGRPALRPAFGRHDAPVTADPALLSVEKLIGSSLMKDWDTDPGFAGLYGQWTVYLFDTGYQQELRHSLMDVKLDRRLEEYRDHLKFDIWIPELRVKQ